MAIQKYLANQLQRSLNGGIAGANGNSLLLDGLTGGRDAILGSNPLASVEPDPFGFDLRPINGARRDRHPVAARL